MKKRIIKILSFVKRMMLKVYCIFPIKDAIVFESNPDFNDEGYWACKVLMDAGYDKKYKIYWLIKDRDNLKIPEGFNISIIYDKAKSLSEIIKRNYCLATSRYIIDSCAFVNKRRKKQFRWFVFHGRPIKKCNKYFEHCRDFDKITIGASFFEEYFESLGFDKSKFVASGLIRNDVLNKASNYLATLGIKKNNEKVIMWMPTYRQHNTSKEANGIKGVKGQLGLPVIKSVDELKKINELLVANNVVILLKPHQSQNMDYLNVEKMSNIRMITSEQIADLNIQLYEILNETDALITDYSSIYFDYLLMDKPIALTVDDIEEYTNKVGMIFDYFKEIKSNFVKDYDELYSFVEDFIKGNPSLMVHHNEMKCKFNDVLDFSSGEKFIEMFKKIENQK